MDFGLLEFHGSLRLHWISRFFYLGRTTFAMVCGLTSLLARPRSITLMLLEADVYVVVTPLHFHFSPKILIPYSRRLFARLILPRDIPSRLPLLARETHPMYLVVNSIP